MEKTQQPETDDSPVAETPANGEAVPKSEISKLWTRRRVLTLFVSLAAGLVTSVGVPLVRKRVEARKASTKLRANPYFLRKKRSAQYAQTQLAEGFYGRKPRPATAKRQPKRSERVIQYVDAKGRIPFEAKINEAKLEHTLPPELPKSKGKHVNFRRASAIFELAAIEAVKKENYGDACNLLVKGIQYDLDFKGKAKKEPSLRLFDLLAIVALRLKQEKAFTDLISLAEQAKPVVAQQHVGAPPRRKKKKEAASIAPLERRQKRIDEFQKRIQNWTSNGPWRKRILAEPFTWKITAPPDTKNNKSVIVALAIPLAKKQETQNPNS